MIVQGSSIQILWSINCQCRVPFLWISLRVVARLYVGMSVCLCSLDSPLAQSVFIEQPPQIPTIAK